MNILLFLVILLILVIAHEFGHFLVAKLSRMRVDEFAFGFPPRLFSVEKGETRYVFNALPLGGYVKIYGEDPTEVSEGPDLDRSFNHRPLWQRSLVVVAGVVFNMLLAWILVTAILMIGMPASAEDTPYASYVHDPALTILSVAPDSPAAQAKFQEGDAILSVRSGDAVAYPATPEDVSSFVGPRQGEKVTIKVRRKGEVLDLAATPKEGIVAGRAAIGISMDRIGTLRLPLPLALLEGTERTWYYTDVTARGIASFLGGFFRGTSDFSQVTGPVGIVNAVGVAASLGYANLVIFTAIISINLAIINLIPFPALDGGRLLFVLIEGMIRRPIPAKVANTVNATGFALLMLLMVAVTYHDVMKLFS